MEFKLFSQFSNLVYGFSSRKDGSMNRYTGVSNRKRYFREKDIDYKQVVTADLVHGAHVVEPCIEDGGSMLPDVDALVTDKDDLFITVTGSDCFPVYFYDPVQGAVGIAHAGWRGVVAGVATETLGKMVGTYGSRPRDVLVVLGPGMRVCHAEFQEKDLDPFREYPDRIVERAGSYYVDLPGILKDQLLAAGIVEVHFEDSEECTYCDPEQYSSYRRDKPGSKEDIEAMVAYIGK